MNSEVFAKVVELSFEKKGLSGNFLSATLDPNATVLRAVTRGGHV